MLMKFHVFGEVNKDYIVVQVEAQNRSWAKEIAQKENIGFSSSYRVAILLNGIRLFAF